MKIRIIDTRIILKIFPQNLKRIYNSVATIFYFFLYHFLGNDRYGVVHKKRINLKKLLKLTLSGILIEPTNTLYLTISFEQS